MGFKVLVEVRIIDDIKGKGVYLLENVTKGTLLWTDDLVTQIHKDDLVVMLSKMEKNEARVFLRQAFVLADKLDYLNVNPEDDGRYVNHSSEPNCGYASKAKPSVALRDIEKGEEITCNYSGLGSPEWYKDLCKHYGCLSTEQVVEQFSNQ